MIIETSYTNIWMIFTYTACIQYPRLSDKNVVELKAVTLIILPTIGFNLFSFKRTEKINYVNICPLLKMGQFCEYCLRQ